MEQYRDALALRYEVYCVEKGFLPSDDYQGAEETDEFDGMSAHFIASLHGRVVGNMRLVRPFNATFPFQRHCSTFPDVEVRYARSGEVSRLAIGKLRLADVTSNNEARLSDGRSVGLREAIVMCLFKSAVQFTVVRRIDYLYAAMERSLLRLLSRYGVNFSPIGEETDYYGPVVPCYASREQVVAGIREQSVAMHAWVMDGMAPKLGSVIAETLDLARAASPRRKQVELPRPLSGHMDWLPAVA